MRRLLTRVERSGLLSAIIALLFCLSAILGFLVSSSSDRTDTASREGPVAAKTLALTAHDPIYIVGNAGLTTSAGVTRGSGSSSDPYVIEGWEISTPYANGIEIYYVNVYFVIQNCYFHNNEGNGKAIYIWSCSNGTIRDCLCTGYAYGIYVGYSSDSSLVNNTCTRNLHGICLHGCVNATLHQNLFTDDGVIISEYESDAWSISFQQRLSYFNTHSIDLTNTANGNPIYYYRDQTGITVPAGAGQVLMANCTNMRIENQYLSATEVGIEIAFCAGINATGNTCRDSSNGIVLYESNNNSLFNNVCISNMEYGVDLVYSDNNSMINDNCSLNGLSGIRLDASDGNSVIENLLCSNNQCGISFSGGEHNEFWGNTIASNGDAGVSVWECSPNNVFFHNNLIGNSPQVNVSQPYVEGSWDNGYQVGGNYWSDYSGQDNNSDGYGDTSYVMGGGSVKDRYPLMTPWTPSWKPPEWVGEAGIKAGDWVKYAYSYMVTPETVYTEWVKVEFTNVTVTFEATIVAIRGTMHLSNGTELTEAFTVHLSEWMYTPVFDTLTGFLMHPNSTVGDQVWIGDTKGRPCACIDTSTGSESASPIEGETERTYAGTLRTIVYADFSFIGHGPLTCYWDKETGVLVEMSNTASDGWTAAVVDTNMWQAEPSPSRSPADSTVIYALVIAAIVIVVAVAFLVIRRRRGPDQSIARAEGPPTAPPET